MKDGKMVLIAQLLLESRTGAYLKWLSNKVIMTANKTWCTQGLFYPIAGAA